MTDSLPAWYPLANATDAQITAWSRADRRPYDEMREALPWLKTEAQLDGWLDAVRDIDPATAARLAEFLPGLAKIPLPPRCRQEVEEQ